MPSIDPKMESSTEPREMTLHRLRRCIALLERVYGVPKRRGLGPVDILVQTILSQNTTSANTHRAFESLKRRYPDYQALLDAPDEDVARSIRCGGLAAIKARRIKEALEMIRGRKVGDDVAKGGQKADSGDGAGPGRPVGAGGPGGSGGAAGRIDLDFLKDLDPKAARDYLLALPGVGPKTAAVVLLFGFNMPLIPVDTHVNRLSRRLGFVPEAASIGEAEEILEAMTPVDKYCSFHVNLIRHGRAVCKARSPACAGCVLGEICPSAGIGGQKG